MLEVAEIFRRYGAAWREEHQGHISLDQLKVMSAIECCRSAALGGHVLQCKHCDHIQIAYNSCRNRHCPKCQGSAAKRWLAARQNDLLPVAYYHVVFSLPAAIADIAYQNKREVYALLFQAAAQTLRTIAADPKHLGAHIGMTMVLHTWGSAMTHHPHVHCIVPGGGFSADGEQWIGCRPGFFLPVRVLSHLFRRLFLEKLTALYRQGELRFYGQLAHLNKPLVFLRYLQPSRRQEWVLYAKQPFAGPSAVLAYLSRYTHRVAIANSRLRHIADDGIRFTWKDYREQGTKQQKVMTLRVDDFIQRFLLHVLPKGFHRIRHYGFFANAQRIQKISQARQLLETDANKPQVYTHDIDNKAEPLFVCPLCASPMIIIEVLDSEYQPRAPPKNIAA